MSIAIGAAIAVMTGIGAGLGIGYATAKSSEAIARQPEASGQISKNLILGCALAEATAIYGFLIGILLIFMIIWVFVDLLILFVLMKKFLFGPITQMLDDRAQQVSDTLDQADKRLAEAEQQQTAHAAQLASAKQEAAQIIEEARARGQQEYDRLVAEAQTAVQRLDEQAARRRESERTQMLREAKKEITALVLLTTAKVSRQKLNSDTDRAMIDDFLREETEAAR